VEDAELQEYEKCRTEGCDDDPCFEQKSIDAFRWISQTKNPTHAPEAEGADSDAKQGDVKKRKPESMMKVHRTSGFRSEMKCKRGSFVGCLFYL
jgi:hypothetical protein